MIESQLQLIDCYRCMFCVFFATAYAYGGLYDKRIRRIGDAVMMTGACLVFSELLGRFSWWYLTILPMLFGALSVGYGGDDLKTKIIKRGRYALGCSLAFISMPIITHSWLAWVFYTLALLLVVVLYGVWNPLKARTEETLIGLIISTAIFII